MPFFRRSYKQKPQIYGPVSQVQSSIFQNAERIGIDPSSIELLLPLWSPGSPFDYTKFNVFDSFEGTPSFSNNRWNFLGDTFGDASITASNLKTGQIGTGQFTFIIRASLNSNAVGGGFFSINNYDPTFAYDANETFYIYDTSNLGASTSVLPFGTVFSLGFVRNSTLTNGTDYYFNGKKDRSITYNANISATTFTIGSDRPAIGLSLEGSIDHIILCSTALSQHQIAYLSDNPYSLLQRVTPVFFSLPAGESVSLYINNISQAQFLSNQDLTQANILVINNLSQTQNLSALDLVQQNIIAISNITQNQIINSLSLSQANLLDINNVTQSQLLSNLDLLSGLTLEINSISQSQNVSNLSLAQANILSIGNITQQQILGSIVLPIGVILEIASLIQSQNISTVNLLQNNILDISDLSQSQSIENIILDADILLQIANIIQSQSFDTLNLTQANILAINNILQSQSITAISFVTVKGKVQISFILSTPVVSSTLSTPSIGYNINQPNVNFILE